jgi:hypothetical protein
VKFADSILPCIVSPCCLHIQFTSGFYTEVKISPEIKLQMELKMFKNILFRVLAGLVLLAAIAGIAFFAFDAGMARGMALNIQVPAAPSDGQPPLPYAYGRGYGMSFGHPFFGFGCFAPLMGLFLLFLAFSAMRRMLWGPRMGMHHHMHGHWGEKGPDGDFVPPMFAEWHKRAHAAGDQAPEASQK